MQSYVEDLAANTLDFFPERSWVLDLAACLEGLGYRPGSVAALCKAARRDGTMELLPDEAFILPHHRQIAEAFIKPAPAGVWAQYPGTWLTTDV
jgi:hypothetical protein